MAEWLAWLTSNCGRIGALGSSPSNGLKPKLSAQKGFNPLCQCVYVYVCIVKLDIQTIHICSHTSIHTYIRTYIHTILISPELVRHLNMCVLSKNPTYIQDIFKYIKYIHTYVRTYIVRTYIHTYVHRYIHTYVSAYIHTYIRKYIHTYIHTSEFCDMLFIKRILKLAVLFPTA